MSAETVEINTNTVTSGSNIPLTGTHYKIADNVQWTIEGKTLQDGFFTNNNFDKVTIEGKKAKLYMNVTGADVDTNGNPQPANALGEAGANVDVDTLIIKSKKYGIYQSTVNYVPTTNPIEVSANTIQITTEDESGIYSAASNKGVFLRNFNTLDITSGDNAVKAHNGLVSIEGDTATLTSSTRGVLATLGTGSITADVNKLTINATINTSSSDLRKNSAVSAEGGKVALYANTLNINVEKGTNAPSNVYAIASSASGLIDINSAEANVNGDIKTFGELKLNGKLNFNGKTADITKLTGNQAQITLANTDQRLNIATNSNNALTVAISKDVTTDIDTLKGLVTNTNAEQSKKITWLIEGAFDGNIMAVGDGAGTVVASQEIEALQTFGSNILNKITVLGLKNDVRKRLGDIRHVDAEQGAWVRYEGGRMSASGYSNKLNTLQIGYDTKALADGVRLGAAVSYTRNDGEMDNGAADGDTYALSLYSTWMGDNGMYADVIARVASVKNDVTVFGTSQTYNDDMSNTAYSITGEFGQRFDIAKTFFVEPQVEMVYTYVDSGKLHMADSTTKFDSINSLIGRAGMVFGWNCPNDKGHVYFRASALKEFKGDSKLTTDGGNIFKTDGKDTWAELGLGAQYNVNKNIHVWADVERTQGAKVNEDFRGTLGVRVSF